MYAIRSYYADFTTTVRSSLLRDSKMTQQSLSYRDAGVDIDAGDALVERIKPFAKKTLREGVLGGLGGFGALFEVPKRYKEPVLVSGTDGVGTKLKLAFDLNRHDTVGIDLVAMSVNEVLVQGAVITSYSIHYTKLYEAAVLDSGDVGGDCAND